MIYYVKKNVPNPFLGRTAEINYILIILINVDIEHVNRLKPFFSCTDDQFTSFIVLNYLKEAEKYKETHTCI